MMVLMPCLRVIAEQIPFAAHVITHFVSYAVWPCVLSGYPCNYFVHRDVEASSSSLALASHGAHWHLAGFCHQKPGTAGFGALFPTCRAWHFRHNDLDITAGRQLFGETTGHGRAALIGIAVYAGIWKPPVSQPRPFCHAEVPPVWEHLVWHCVDPVLAQGRPEPPLDEVLGGRQIAAAPVLLRCWHTRPDAGMCVGGCDFPFCLGYGVLLRCTGSCGLLLGDGGIWSW